MIYTIGIILILFSIALILTDVLVIPGGFVGTAGFLVTAGYIFYVYRAVDAQIARYLIYIYLASMVITLFVIWKFKLWRILAHQSKLKKSVDLREEVDSLKDKTAVTLTRLAPGGKVEVDGKKYDAISDSGFIEKGEQVRIIGRAGAQVKVFAIK